MAVVKRNSFVEYTVTSIPETFQVTFDYRGLPSETISVSQVVGDDLNKALHNNFYQVAKNGSFFEVTVSGGVKVGDKVHIERQTVISQDIAYQQEANVTDKQVVGAFDKITKIAQELRDGSIAPSSENTGGIALETDPTVNPIAKIGNPDIWPLSKLAKQNIQDFFQDSYHGSELGLAGNTLNAQSPTFQSSIYTPPIFQLGLKHQSQWQIKFMLGITFANVPQNGQFKVEFIFNREGHLNDPNTPEKIASIIVDLPIPDASGNSQGNDSYSVNTTSNNLTWANSAVSLNTYNLVQLRVTWLSGDDLSIIDSASDGLGSTTFNVQLIPVGGQQNFEIEDDSIETSMLKDKLIESAKVDDSAILTKHIADKAITKDLLADGVLSATDNIDLNKTVQVFPETVDNLDEFLDEGYFYRARDISYLSGVPKPLKDLENSSESWVVFFLYSSRWVSTNGDKNILQSLVLINRSDFNYYRVKTEESGEFPTSFAGVKWIQYRLRQDVRTTNLGAISANILSWVSQYVFSETDSYSHGTTITMEENLTDDWKLANAGGTITAINTMFGSDVSRGVVVGASSRPLHNRINFITPTEIYIKHNFPQDLYSVIINNVETLVKRYPTIGDNRNFLIYMGGNREATQYYGHYFVDNNGNKISSPFTNAITQSVLFKYSDGAIIPIGKKYQPAGPYVRGKDKWINIANDLVRVESFPDEIVFNLKDRTQLRAPTHKEIEKVADLNDALTFRAFDYLNTANNKPSKFGGLGFISGTKQVVLDTEGGVFSREHTLNKTWNAWRARGFTDVTLELGLSRISVLAGNFVIKIVGGDIQSANIDLPDDFKNNALLQNNRQGWGLLTQIGDWYVMLFGPHFYWTDISNIDWIRDDSKIHSVPSDILVGDVKSLKPNQIGIVRPTAQGIHKEVSTAIGYSFPAIIWDKNGINQYMLKTRNTSRYISQYNRSRVVDNGILAFLPWEAKTEKKPKILAEYKNTAPDRPAATIPVQDLSYQGEDFKFEDYDKIRCDYIFNSLTPENKTSIYLAGMDIDLSHIIATNNLRGIAFNENSELYVAHRDTGIFKFYLDIRNLTLEKKDWYFPRQTNTDLLGEIAYVDGYLLYMNTKSNVKTIKQVRIADKTVVKTFTKHNLNASAQGIAHYLNPTTGTNYFMLFEQGRLTRNAYSISGTTMVKVNIPKFTRVLPPNKVYYDMATAKGLRGAETTHIWLVNDTDKTVDCHLIGGVLDVEKSVKLHPDNDDPYGVAVQRYAEGQFLVLVSDHVKSKIFCYLTGVQEQFSAQTQLNKSPALSPRVGLYPMFSGSELYVKPVQKSGQLTYNQFTINNPYIRSLKIYGS